MSVSSQPVVPIPAKRDTGDGAIQKVTGFAVNEGYKPVPIPNLSKTDISTHSFDFSNNFGNKLKVK